MKTLKKIYSKEYLLLIGIRFLPLMWKILEICFLSSFDNALKILGQIALISIIFKIFEESILNPLYKILSKQNLKTDEEKQISRLEIVIHEGKNRQVRRMCEAVGRKVLALHRTKIGNIQVKDLKLGPWRYLSKQEVEYLKN